MAVWQRPVPPEVSAAAQMLLGGASFAHAAEGQPNLALGELAAMTFIDAALRRDIGVLADIFATLAGSAAVRLRFELVTDDACSCFHVDNVGLRLLCTYAGLGTEWQDDDAVVHRVPTGSVVLLKGTRFPDRAPRVPHRSPPIEHLPPRQRPRLLLVIDEPGVF